MITGYNTDVRHNSIVFHVQTEDKGAANPLIESLVYVGGQVVAARRASYSELLADGQGENPDKAVLTLMDRQHRTMIAAIRSGRFDAKLAELQGVAPPEPAEGTVARAPTSAAAAAAVVAAAEELLPEEEPEEAAAAVAAAAVAAPVSERTLDQVILEYLTSEAEQEHLQLSLEDASALSIGERAYLVIRARSSRSGDGVAGAKVTVKMISTVDSPQALAHGTTDEHGSLRLVFDIPTLGRGTAALIIGAASPLGRAEIKHLL
jgi:hypothetical protein